MLIETKNLIREYKSGDITTMALKGVSFGIEKGEFVSIMGPSGSGTSTLIHILGLLERYDQGIYKFENHHVNNLSDNERAHLRNDRIGFIFQAFNLLPRTTVLENVKLPLLYSDKKINADKRAVEVLTAVGLSHRLNYYTNQISGGEQQRVAIARALINDPSVIFADEPTGNLDSKSGLQIMEILQDLNEQGNTIILVTHETATAEFAKRIIKIRDGEIIDDSNLHKRRRAKDGLLK